MSNFAKKLSVTLALGLAAASTTMAARADDSPSMAPQRLSAQSAQTAPATAQWVNVNRGDTVSFEQNGQRYTVRLNKSADGVDLSSIAPKGAQLSGVSLAVTADQAGSN